ncbi:MULTISPECIES: antitoxin [Kitasatospora]|uniref:Kanamycin biosynthetic protein n=1 Tax=Kitasatospora cystarginea TaxID=58350 RepID=A0ABN3DS43_9ACTN
MSVMDKVRQMLKGHEEQAMRGIDKAGDFFDEKTHGRYSSRVHSTQDKLKEQLGVNRPPDEPPQQ